MAAAYRSSTSTSTGAATASSLQVDVPAGIQVNDILLAVITLDGGTGSSMTPPAGWTSLRINTQGSNTRQHVYWRITNGQEAANYTWTFDTTRMASAAMVAYSGSHPFTPPALASTSSAGPTSTLTAATTNATYETGLVVQIISTRNTTTAATTTPGAGYTIREDVCTSASTFMETVVEDQTKGLTIGGTTANASTCSTGATTAFVAQVIFLEDARPAFAILGEDEFAVGSLTTSNTSINVANFQTNYLNELILAFISINKDTATVSSMSAGSLTWVNVGRANTKTGCVELWRTFATALVTPLTVTANFSGSVVSANIMVVGIVGADFTGTSGSGAIGAFNTGSSTSAAPTISVTTTRDNSWVWGATNAAGVTGGMTAGTGQTILRNQNDTTNTALGWMQRQNALTPTSGTSVTINSTAPSTASCNTLAVEVLPAVYHNLGTSGVG